MTVETPMLEQGLFSAVSAVTQRAPGRFSAEVDPEWTIGAKPNGGYLLSMLARAATSSGGHDHVVAASAHYLHSPDPGPVLIETQLLRAGRSASQIRARMEQDGKACVEALLTASSLAADTTPYWGRGLPERSEVSYEDCSRLIPNLPNGIRVAIMEQAEVRLEPDSSGFTAGRPVVEASSGGGWPSPAPSRSTPTRCSSQWTRSRRPPSTSSSPDGCRPWS
jgi:hypothetical protein